MIAYLEEAETLITAKYQFESDAIAAVATALDRACGDGMREMLDALKAAKELAGVMEGLSAGRSDDAWIWAAQKKINEAIAKAEGK